MRALRPLRKRYPAGPCLTRRESRETTMANNSGRFGEGCGEVPGRARTPVPRHQFRRTIRMPLPYCPLAANLGNQKVRIGLCLHISMI